MKFDLNDLFTFTGLITLAVGVAYNYSPSVAAMVAGTLLFVLGVWKA